jgi:PE family
MESMSHDQAAAGIGSQLVDNANRGLDAGGAAMMPLTGLIPAGAEEVSAQAATAFAAEGAEMLAWNTAAQEELGRTGVALVDIARMYSQVDNAAAGSLAFSGSQFSSDPLPGGTGSSVGAGLIRADTLPGAGGSVARTPLMAQLIEGATPSNPSATLPAAVNAASSAVATGIAPLSSVGQGGAAGGSARPGLASSLDQDEDAGDGDESGDQSSGERLL